MNHGSDDFISIIPITYIIVQDNIAFSRIPLSLLYVFCRLYAICCIGLSDFIFSHSQAQTLGGSSVFNFVKLSNTPQLTALGGINTSVITDDIGPSFNNPSLLRPQMHEEFSAVFNSLYGGIKNYHAMMGYYHEKRRPSFSAGVLYFDYGTLSQTDASGNLAGDFHPVDYVAQLSAARKYGTDWHYGATLKFLHSSYGIYRSSGLALDIGAAYFDSTKGLQFSLVAKNMGVQITKYAGSAGDELPFDVQAGISKKLAHAPLQFSFTAHHLHRFNLLYRDTVFNNQNGFEQGNEASQQIFKKVLLHFIFATQLYIGDKIEVHRCLQPPAPHRTQYHQCRQRPQRVLPWRGCLVPKNPAPLRPRLLPEYPRV